MATMLIVEDDPAWRGLYLMEFGKQFDVFEAKDGLQALAMLDWLKPDIILIDLRLPRMDGQTFLRQLERKGAHAPVVICSGALPEDGIPIGGAQVAPKSADLRYVRSAVRAAIRSPFGSAALVGDSSRPYEPEWLD